MKEEKGSLYISNLNERVPPKELRKALLIVFSQFGIVVDIFTAKKYKLRGQAWVIYADSSSTASAIQVLQGFPFYNKPLNLASAMKFPATTSGLKDNKSNSARDGRHNVNKIKEGSNKVQSEIDMGSKNKLNKRLLSIQGLPVATTEQMLSLLFKQFPGFLNVRKDSSKLGVALVEFQSTDEASTALSGLQGFRLNSTHTMQIEYAK